MAFLQIELIQMIPQMCKVFLKASIDISLQDLETPYPIVYDPQQDISVQSQYFNGTHLVVSYIRQVVSDDFADEILTLEDTMIWIYMNGQNATYTDPNWKQIKVYLGQSYKCHYLCQSCLGPFRSDCLSCTVTNTQQIDGYCMISDLEAPLASQELIDEDFIFSWGYPFYYPDHIFIHIDISLCDWFAVGFNNTDMKGTDMVVFMRGGEKYLDSHSQGFKFTNQYISIYDMYSLDEKVPLPDSKYGGQNDWKLMGWNINPKSNRIQVKARRLLNTNDIYDYKFNKQSTNVIWAFANNTNGEFTRHNITQRGYQLVPMDLNDTRSLLTRWEQIVYKGHTSVLAFVYGFLSDGAVFFAREMKHYPKYIQVHGILTMIISTTTFFYTSAMISVNYSYLWVPDLRNKSRVIQAHFAIGIIIITLLLFQNFLGWAIKTNLESLKGDSSVYPAKNLHKYIGFSLYFTGKLNILIGVYIYDRETLLYIVLYFFLVIMVWMIIEASNRLGIGILSYKQINFAAKGSDIQLLQQRLVDRVNADFTYHQIKEDFPQINYIILKNIIYDITSLQHPGGQFIFQQVQGTEVGRYIYGGRSTINENFTPHKHTYFAIQYLNTREIGYLDNQSCPILYVPYDKLPKIKNSDELKHQIQIWKLVQISSFREDIKIFTFQSEFFYVRQQLQGVSWLGRYFYIKPYSFHDVHERPYSICLSMTPENIESRQRMIDFFMILIDKKGTNHHTIYPDRVRFTQNLSFFIRRLPGSKHFSRFVHESYQKQYEISGPHGLGLYLNQHSSGCHYFICAGTGVLPVLDLVDFLFRRHIYTNIRRQFGDQMAKHFLPHDYSDQLMPHQYFRSNFQLILFAAFRSKDLFIGRELVQDLHMLSKQSPDSYFEVKIRYSQPEQDGALPTVTRFFDSTFLLENMKNPPARVYISGPPEFERTVMKSLLVNHVEEKVIIKV